MNLLKLKILFVVPVVASFLLVSCKKSSPLTAECAVGQNLTHSGIINGESVDGSGTPTNITVEQDIVKSTVSILRIAPIPSSSNSSVHLCTGTLLKNDAGNTRYILTAAHCFYDFGTDSPLINNATTQGMSFYVFFNTQSALLEKINDPTYQSQLISALNTSPNVLKIYYSAGSWQYRRHPTSTGNIITTTEFPFVFNDNYDLTIIKLQPTVATTLGDVIPSASSNPSAATLATNNFPSGVAYTPIKLAAANSLSNNDAVYTAGYGQRSALKSSECTVFGGQYGELFQTSGVVQYFLDANSKQIITGTNLGSHTTNGASDPSYMISTTGDHTSTICSGDSGGPLFKYNSGVLELVGVSDIAYTDQYGNCVTDSNFLHVNVTNTTIRAWINSIIP